MPMYVNVVVIFFIIIILSNLIQRLSIKTPDGIAAGCLIGVQLLQIFLTHRDLFEWGEKYIFNHLPLFYRRIVLAVIDLHDPGIEPPTPLDSWSEQIEIAHIVGA